MSLNGRLFHFSVAVIATSVMCASASVCNENEKDLPYLVGKSKPYLAIGSAYEYWSSDLVDEKSPGHARPVLIPHELRLFFPLSSARILLLVPALAAGLVVDLVVQAERPPIDIIQARGWASATLAGPATPFDLVRTVARTNRRG